jgi:isoleucyl-tRNA synthetase
MSKMFPEYKNFNLSDINKEVLKRWRAMNTFQLSISSRENNPSFVFYEGPPSANGKPGIHHVMARTIKDIICRYKTLDGYRVDRKAGWDTHGLPVELGVEKILGITKDDIGKTISIAEYNEHCRKDVMKYTTEWEELTDLMGYWVDMDHPYITYDNRYIETLWWLLKQFFEKNLLYKGYTIQPYSPAAGTGLSTHELNQPGCYRDVKDTTAVAMFKVIQDGRSKAFFEGLDSPLYIMAWTTTPWTLPSNTALAVGPDIDYVKVRSFNPYSSSPITVILAKNLLYSYFPEKNKDLSFGDYNEGDKFIPYKILSEFKGSEIVGFRYEQLLDWVNPGEKAFSVIPGAFVTTEDGTGIVHIAPTFGADDYRVAKENDISPLLVKDIDGNLGPLVDKKGRFIPIADLDPEFVRNSVNIKSYRDFAGRYVKNDYDDTLAPDATTADIDISVYLKHHDLVFRVEKHVHNYPHCWRTDKPVLYYPLDSWFIRTTAMKDRMIELNNTINWKPESTGTGRFGKWLENLVDWNLSRSRFWGTPLPIWVSEDKQELKCIGSVEELKNEIELSLKVGFMKTNPLTVFVPGNNSPENYSLLDLHRPFVDEIILVSASGKKMIRETDLIDVWFDSGAMPYAQLHYPFEHKEDFKDFFPATFIAEGVDQTRGWFFTLHAIATMLFDSVSFKNIISNGLVLDKSGNKMSKRLGNAVDPFTTIEEYGSDPLRWYMITNAQPWDNLKFDIGGIDEVKRKFFGTLYNTYSFFALYANVDKFSYAEKEIPMEQRPEIDRWIISLLNSLVKEVKENYDNYELTRAGRLIQEFVIENLSNWYVRLNRKRFWGGEYDTDKISAYQTLYQCLETVSILASPIAPFYMDKLFGDLNTATGKSKEGSVHLVKFPVCNESLINPELEERMNIAQTVSSMVLGLRRKVSIRVRQPLNKIMIPLFEKGFKEKFEAIKPLILSEVNVKDVEYINDTAGILVKKIKPNFKTLGPKYGKMMKEIAAEVNALKQPDILRFEQEGLFAIYAGSEMLTLIPEDVEITSEDIPGWLVANEGKITVALDINISDELRQEGIAREFVNRIQNLRKDSGFDVTDKILVEIQKHDFINHAIENFKDYISSQTLAKSITLVELIDGESKEVEIDEEIKTRLRIEKGI